MRVLTVRNPWAWAIIHAGKTVENRPRNVAGDFRGPVAIQAGRAWDERWREHRTAGAMREAFGGPESGLMWLSLTGRMMARAGQILGVVDLVDVHDGRECETDAHAACSEWAVPGYIHLELRDPRPIAEPIIFRGNLGLQTLDEETAARVTAAIS